MKRKVIIFVTRNLPGLREDKDAGTVIKEHGGEG
jgi:hypothetical protein